MNTLKETAWSRRKFISSVPGFLVAAGIVSDPIVSAGYQDVPELPQELTAEEKKLGGEILDGQRYVQLLRRGIQLRRIPFYGFAAFP